MKITTLVKMLVALSLLALAPRKVSSHGDSYSKAATDWEY